MNAQEYDFDVIIVGGGIHGVGAAQAIAIAGYSVLLIEKSEIGSGTSSKSSKLIHGGLRYLESFQFSLVKECLSERSLLLRNAPDLVRMIPFYIPIYKTTQRRPWKIAAGLHLYDLLSGFNYPFEKVPKSEWTKLDGLNCHNLETVYKYYDAQTDDAMLTQAVAKSALAQGAVIQTGTELLTCKITENGCQVEIKGVHGNKHYSSRVLINAAGAAVNELLQRCEPQQRILPIDLVQGAHIVLNTSARNGVYYLEAPSDKRAVFTMPWKGKTLVGTTETHIEHYTATPAALPEEISYLLEVYNTYFPEDRKTTNDVVEKFAGLRVLLRDEKSVFARARDTVLHVDSERNPRILSIYGGKLTAYRATAEKVLRRVSVNLPDAQRKNISTSTLKIGN